MNDPGLDQPVGETADDLERNPYEDMQKQEEAEEQNFLDPSRWWFASTAFPLIAGTFGPMANAFSICALVQSWRVYVPPKTQRVYGKHIPDPGWLITVNAVSLAAALISNLSLLLNMSKRLRFEIAQPITIIGFFLAASLLTALVVAANTSTFRLEPRDEHALSQAFYYAIMAAALYFIITFLMIVTVWGAIKKHYPKEFRLTVSQRTLMLQTIMFMMYLLLGACIYTYIEGWEFLDAVYWADFTLLTVGIGDDLVPTTHLGRSLLFPFAIGGIVTVGLVVGSVRTLVLERAKAKMEARITEKRREKALRNVNPRKRTIKVAAFRTMSFNEEGLSETQRREEEFKVMRVIQKKSADHRRWFALGVSTLATCILWFVGALIFKLTEADQGWSYFVSLYFAYTSLLTIGYGDFQVSSNSGRPFFVFWSLLAVPTLTILISNMGDTVVKVISDLTIWAGSLTILPGEKGIKAGIRLTYAEVRKRYFKSSDFRVDQPPGFLGKRANNNDDEGGFQKEQTKSVEHQTLDRMAKHLEGEELEAAQLADNEQDSLRRDIHFYHYVLSREIRNVMRDVNASPPKQYDYAEWAYFLRLIGQDEADSSLHRAPKIKPKREAKVGEANGSVRDADSPPITHEDVDNRRNPMKWSWLGTRSPLMDQKSEAVWILERLSAALEAEMARVHAAKEHPRPPISMSELRERIKEKERHTLQKSHHHKHKHKKQQQQQQQENSGEAAKKEQ